MEQKEVRTTPARNCEGNRRHKPDGLQRKTDYRARGVEDAGQQLIHIIVEQQDFVHILHRDIDRPISGLERPSDPPVTDQIRSY